jgi:glycerol-3-phosphate cytidylyltransferase
MNSNKKYNTGLTFGAYDPWHFGHERLLENAKKLCNILIVCVSDKDYIKKYKNRKEFIPLKKRMKIVSECKYVNIVDKQSLKFGKKEAIVKYKPDVLFVGSDHRSNYAGVGLGVDVVYLPHTDGISSTMLREKLHKK